MKWINVVVGFTNTYLDINHTNTRTFADSVPRHRTKLVAIESALGNT